MPWGSVQISYGPTDYTQNYKRNGVVSHDQCRAMVADAVADSVDRITANPPAGGLPAGGVNVKRSNITQNEAEDPGPDFRPI